MDGTRFRLVVHNLKKLNGFCTAVEGVVEGSSISVNDYLCLNRTDGKRIKLRVESILVTPKLEVRTAEPGKAVWLVLRGRRAKQIRRGDILEPPATGRRRHSTTAEVLSVILSFLLIANLINIAICLPMGWQDNISEILRYSLVLGAVNIPMLLAVELWDFLSRRRWRQKQQRDDWETDFRVLKCSPIAYLLLLLPAAITVMAGLSLYLWGMDEPQTLQTLWARGELNQELLTLFGLDLLCIGSFLHSTWRKVFYSRRLLRVVSFGIAHDIPWTQLRSILLLWDKKNARMILRTAEKTISLRSDVLSDGWGDFLDFALTMAGEHGIPYELQNVKHIGRFKRR